MRAMHALGRTSGFYTLDWNPTRGLRFDLEAARAWEMVASESSGPEGRGFR